MLCVCLFQVCVCSVPWFRYARRVGAWFACVCLLYALVVCVRVGMRVACVPVVCVCVSVWCVYVVCVCCASVRSLLLLSLL